MKKRSRKAKKTKVVKPKIKVVKLAPATVLHVAVPKTLVPVVVPQPDIGVVAIVPVPKAKRTWWQSLWS